MPAQVDKGAPRNGYTTDASAKARWPSPPDSERMMDAWMGATRCRGSAAIGPLGDAAIKLSQGDASPLLRYGLTTTSLPSSFFTLNVEVVPFAPSWM